ncbi:hypothetical protein MJ561_07445 [Klebsiella pneumoniae]|nr:hypothetical protein MJ561_07445 [Klebsiella pneumoniae]
MTRYGRLRRRAEEVPDRSADQRNDDRRNKYGGDFIRQLISGLLLCRRRCMRIILAGVVWLPTALAVSSTLPSRTTVPA